MKSQFLVLHFCLISFLLPLWGDDYHAKLNVFYSQEYHKHRTVDLYFPNDQITGQQRPLIVWLHGGAWRGGSKNDWRVSFPEMAEIFLKNGFVVAAADYRLSNEVDWPNQIIDARLCIRFLRKNQARFGIDPDHIGVWGHSAGAHIAALVALCANNTEFNGSELPEISSQVQAAVLEACPFDFTDPQVSRFLAYFFETNATSNLDGILKMVSPQYYLHDRAPPMAIIHGWLDQLFPWENAQRFVAKIMAINQSAEHPISYSWTLITDMDHDIKTKGTIVSKRLRHCIRFLYTKRLGDINLNGECGDDEDFILLENNLGATPRLMTTSNTADMGWDPLCDLNGDNRVDEVDILKLKRLRIKPAVVDSVEYLTNESLFLLEHLVRISWSNHPDNIRKGIDVAGYRLYKRWGQEQLLLLAELDASETTFFERNIDSHDPADTTYRVSVVELDESGTLIESWLE